MTTTGNATQSGGVRRPVALITGGGSGIGRATAERFSSEGWAVSIVDVVGASAAESAERINATLGEPRARAFTADVSDTNQLLLAIESTARQQGGLDALINNAAVVGPGPIDAQDGDLWRSVMSVGAEAVLHSVRLALPYLRRSSYPSVSNVASVVALQGEAGVAAYCASKGAILSLTRALAVELASDNIRVNAVCPGVTDTAQTSKGLSASRDSAADLKAMMARVPQRRLIEAHEIAAVLFFLASPDASALTGSTIVVDAGLTAGWR